jgi:hypothetical protein
VGIEPAISSLLYYKNKPLRQLSPNVEITLEIRDRVGEARKVEIKIKIGPTGTKGLLKQDISEASTRVVDLYVRALLVAEPLQLVLLVVVPCCYDFIIAYSNAC